MAGHKYPFDKTGKATTNRFKEEWFVESDESSNRVLILQHRPFFGTLSIYRNDGVFPLIEGKDYEYVHQFTELDETLETPVYNGISIVNREIKGKLIIEGNLLGGSFYDESLDVFNGVVLSLNNPPVISWNDIDYPAYFPPSSGYLNWNNLKNKKYIGAGLSDIGDAMTGSATNVTVNFDDLNKKVNDLSKEIDVFDFKGHISAIDPHGVTYSQLGAYPKTGKVVDAKKAFGKTLPELITAVRSKALQSSDLSKYVDKWGVASIKGSYTIRNVILNRNSTSGILHGNGIANDTPYRVFSIGSAFLETGKTGKITISGVKKWVLAGTGDTLSPNALTVDGATIITTANIHKYQPLRKYPGYDPSNFPLASVVTEKKGLTLDGNGTAANPLTPKVTLSNIYGEAMILRESATDEGHGYGVTVKALKPYLDKQETYIPRTTPLNGRAYGNSYTFTKNDISGLSNVSNVRDVDKPVSEKAAKLASDLAVLGHKHTWASLNVPAASTTKPGIWSLVQGLPYPNKGVVTPSSLATIRDTVADMTKYLENVDVGNKFDYLAVSPSVVVPGTPSNLYVDFVAPGIKYFYMTRDGARYEGSVTPTRVAISPVEKATWYRYANDTDLGWPQVVIDSTVNAASFGSLTPPNGGSFICRPLTDINTNPAINTSGTQRERTYVKERFLTDGQTSASIYIAGGSRWNIYVDDVKVATDKVGPAKVDFGLSASRKSHCVSIEIIRDTVSVDRGRYEIWCGEDLIAYSHKGLRIASAVYEDDAEFICNTLWGTFYIYINVFTGAVRSSPVALYSDGVDPANALVGIVRHVYQKVIPSQLTGSVDYGMFTLLRDHEATTAVHVPSSSDYRISDNPNVLRMGVSSLAPVVAAIASGATKMTGTAYVPSGMLVAQEGLAENAAMGAWFFEDKQWPGKWLTPANPYESNSATYEGSFAMSCTEGISIADSLELVFATTAQITNHRVLRVGVKNKLLSKGIYETRKGKHSLTAALAAENFVYSGITGATVTTATRDVGINNTDWPLDSIYTAPDGSPRYSSVSRYVLRYRYVVKTKTLKIHLQELVDSSAAHPNQARIRNVTETTVVFKNDIRQYIQGEGLGVLIRNKNQPAKFAVAGTVVPFFEKFGDRTQYQFYRSLFETYANSKDYSQLGGTASTYSYRTGQIKYVIDGPAEASLYTLPDRGYQLNLGLQTEYVRVPEAGNAEFSQSPQGFPLLLELKPPLQKDFDGAFGNRTSNGSISDPFWATWDYNRRGIVIDRGYTFSYIQEEHAVKARVEIRTNMNVRVYYGGTYAGEVASDGYELKSSEVAIGQGVYPAGTELKLWVSTKGITAPFPMYIDVRFVYDKQAGGYFDKRIENEMRVADVGKAMYLVKQNPWLLTSQNWDWVKSIIDEEKAVSVSTAPGAYN